MAITVKPRHPALGAEIRGVDMKKPLDAETVKQVHDAWMKHLVVVFPDQQITDQEHVAFTRNFGEAEIFHQTSLHLRSDGVREIFLVSNVDEQNKLLKPSDPGQKQLSSSQQWHTDSSYRPVPSMGSLLHGIEISRTGGITQFINMYMVYDELPESLKRQVEGRKARHDFGMLSRLVGSPPPTAEEKAAMPPVWHPMVRKHPVTGRKCLYISSIYNDAVEGLEEGPRAPADRGAVGIRRPAQVHVPARMGAARRADVGQPLHRACRDAARSQRTPRHASHDHRRARAGGGGLESRPERGPPGPLMERTDKNMSGPGGPRSNTSPAGPTPPPYARPAWATAAPSAGGRGRR